MELLFWIAGFLLAMIGLVLAVTSSTLVGGLVMTAGVVVMLVITVLEARGRPRRQSRYE